MGPGGSWVSNVDGASLSRALAVIIAAGIPLWTLSVWMARSPTPWRWVSDGSWQRWVAWGCAVAAILLCAAGFAWSYQSLLGPALRTEQRIAYGVWVGSMLLGVVGIVWGRAGEQRNEASRRR